MVAEEWKFSYCLNIKCNVFAKGTNVLIFCFPKHNGNHFWERLINNYFGSQSSLSLRLSTHFRFSFACEMSECAAYEKGCIVRFQHFPRFSEIKNSINFSLIPQASHFYYSVQLSMNDCKSVLVNRFTTAKMLLPQMLIEQFLRV